MPASSFTTVWAAANGLSQSREIVACIVLTALSRALRFKSTARTHVADNSILDAPCMTQKWSLVRFEMLAWFALYAIFIWLIVPPWWSLLCLLLGWSVCELWGRRKPVRGK
jgi:hypothetical protein